MMMMMIMMTKKKKIMMGISIKITNVGCKSVLIPNSRKSSRFKVHNVV